jgi:hypothetical protein
MSSRTKIIFAVMAGGIALAAGYLLFFPKSDGGAALSADSVPASAAEVRFLNLAGQIGSITFDTSIFSDLRFSSLVDIHTAILPEAAGRKDPFASLQ